MRSHQRGAPREPCSSTRRYHERGRPARTGDRRMHEIWRRPCSGVAMHVGCIPTRLVVAGGGLAGRARGWSWSVAGRTDGWSWIGRGIAHVDRQVNPSLAVGERESLACPNALGLVRPRRLGSGRPRRFQADRPTLPTTTSSTRDDAADARARVGRRPDRDLAARDRPAARDPMVEVGQGRRRARRHRRERPTAAMVGRRPTPALPLMHPTCIRRTRCSWRRNRA